MPLPGVMVNGASGIGTWGTDRGVYHYVIVSRTDPRYTGDPAWAEWDTWEYHVLVVSGGGNLRRKGGGH